MLRRLREHKKQVIGISSILLIVALVTWGIVSGNTITAIGIMLVLNLVLPQILGSVD